MKGIHIADALTLDPQNPIYQGFLGDSQLIEGQIFKDKREEVHGYFRLKHAISEWPKFNYFTAGYPMSTLPAHSDFQKESQPPERSVMFNSGYGCMACHAQ